METYSDGLRLVVGILLILKPLFFERLPVLGGLNLLSALITVTLPSGHTYPHLTDGDTEAQRGQGTCPKPQSWFGLGCTYSSAITWFQICVSPVKDTMTLSGHQAFPGPICSVRLSIRLMAGPRDSSA